jgi:chromosome segregation ATPase
MPLPPVNAFATICLASTSKRPTCASKASASPKAASAPNGTLADARESLARARNERAQLDVVLGEARAQQARLAQELRSREHDLAGLVARLASLEELEAARTGLRKGARLVLAEANGSVEQHGAVADWLEVDRRYERSAEALLGDLLQTRHCPDAPACGERPRAAPRARCRPVRIRRGG